MLHVTTSLTCLFTSLLLKNLIQRSLVGQIATLSRPKEASLLFLLLIFFCFCSSATAQVDHSSLEHMSEALDWPMNASFDAEFDTKDGVEDGGGDQETARRLLFYYHRSSPQRYYISYGALSANRIPCPPLSGRSYYTRHWYRSSRPVNPCTKGFSSITRCRR